MKPFTNTVAGRKRLLRVCDVVREGLGLGALTHEYHFTKEDQDKLAHSFIGVRGWRLQITFHDAFFEVPLERQLVTVVHEHIHTMLTPLYQHVYDLHDTYVKPTQQDAVWCDYQHVDEITIEHSAPSLLKLLLPQIEKVL